MRTDCIRLLSEGENKKSTQVIKHTLVGAAVSCLHILSIPGAPESYA